MFLCIQRGKAPIRRQLRDQLEALIREGALPPGTRLPSSRVLAGILRISRNTVLEVYDSLVAEGILEPAGAAGTFVAAHRAQAAGAAGRGEQRGDCAAGWQAALSAAARRLTTGAPGTTPPYDPGTDGTCAHWWDERSAEEFRLCLNGVLRRAGLAVLGYAPPEGYGPLREWISGYMRDRGIRVSPREVLIVNGAQQALDLVSRTFIDPGDLVLVQEPVDPNVAACFRHAGAELRGIPVSPSGLDLQSLATALTERVPKLVYLVPTLHRPTGVTMDLATRLRLLECARHHGFLVLEDAFGDELCYPGHLVPPLKAHAGSGQVMYVGSMSRSLFPGIRIGWVVADPDVILALGAAKRTSDRCSSPLLQAALYEFCRRGLYRRHLARLRRVSRARGDALAAALERHLPPRASWHVTDGGTSAWITLPPGVDCLRLLDAADGTGVRIEPGLRYFLNGGGTRHLRLKCGEPSRAETEVASLAALITFLDTHEATLRDPVRGEEKPKEE
ncbi:MAG: PLP-dependent aminotransferase family protein [Bacillota bacterium]|nr:PLP-dependent aminotransferase family protein [Bacillota bacterium]